MNASGIAQWTQDGVLICSNSGGQNIHAITTDGNGGAILAWTDSRVANTTTIYSQRVNSAGLVQWTANGITLSSVTGSQDFPAIVSDGNGGGIIAWADFRDNTNTYVYVQRVDQGGKLRILWDASGWDQLPSSIVQDYIVMMGVRSTGLQGKTSAAGTPSTQADPGIYWQQVTALKASGEIGYNFSVTTAADSGIHGIPWYYFKVVAQTNDPTVYWTTNVDSSYSVDNIPPAPPHSLTAAQVSGSVVLAWQHDRPSDFMWYVIYRSDNSFAGAKNPVPYDTTADSAYVDKNPPAGAKEFYLVRAEDIHGNFSDPSNEAAIVLTGVDEKSAVPKAFALDQNYPNPFNPTTEIGYQLSAVSNVSLKVYDVLGREVASLVDDRQNAGVYRVVFNGAGLPSGVYFYRLVAVKDNGQKYTSIKKFILMK